MLLHRSNNPEIMDDFSIRDTRIDLALKELRKINKYLGGNSTTKAGIRKLLKKTSDDDNKILDVGAGGSDIFKFIHLNNLNFIEYSIDKNLRACKYLRQHSSGINIVCADAFNIPFKEKYFDIIHASLFLHHFNEDQIKDILNCFRQMVKRGIIINDLRRNIFAFSAIKILTLLLSGSKMVRNDAPISVKRGFIKGELIKILHSMDMNNYEIRRKWAFRWLVVIYL